VGLSDLTALNDTDCDKRKKHDQNSEALLGSRANAHDPGRTLQLARQFEVFVENGDTEPGNRQWQRQQVQHGSMALAGQEADPQDGDDAHDEGALVKA